VGILVLLAFVLITLSFRGSANGIQGFGAAVLRPFEVGAERVARPFRDAAGWTKDVLNAKSENKKLKEQVTELQRQVIANESALQENADYRRQLDFIDSPSFQKLSRDYAVVATRVVSQPTSRFEQTIVIAAGSGQGIRVRDPVITATGLVGQVTKVFSREARVTLLTDPGSAASASVLTDPSTIGVVQHGQGSAESLILDRVPKSKPVHVGDVIVTSGSPGPGELPSLYPRGIQIGVVSSTGDSDTEPFKQIQVDPSVDYTSLQSVLVLVPKQPAPILP
jgi:rod shape-determining protein MreC